MFESRAGHHIKMNKLLAIVSFIIGIVLVEVSLQSYGLYLGWKRNQFEPMLEGKIRILVLGESTTDSIFAPEAKPWPTFLQKYLNEKNQSLKFEVINKAIAGTSTIFLLQNLPDNLKKYKPHLVIAMMGINDTSSLGYLHKESFWSKLKLVRIYRSWQESRKNSFEENHEGIWEIITKIGSPQQISPEYYRFIEKHPDRAWILKRFLAAHFLNISQVMVGKQLHDTEKAAFQLAKEALSLNPRDSFSAVFLCQSAIRQKGLQAEARNVMKEVIKKGFVGNETNYIIFDFIKYQEDPELVTLLDRMGFEHNPMRQIDMTKRSFRLLEKLVKDSGSRLAIMAYPATDSNLFKHFYTDHVFEGDSLRENIMIPLPEAKVPEEYRHIIFIENKNFPSHYDSEFYLDLFAKSLRTGTGFGHTTKKGHELIGRNAGEILMKEWVGTLQNKD